VDDLKGKRFGRLVVLSRILTSGGGGKHIRWECICDCGNLHSAKSSHLKVGNVASCGCLVVETARKEIKLGTKFGRWVVKEQIVNRRRDGRGNELTYRCVCECGNMGVVRGTKLRNGSSVSCGCYGAELTGIRSRTHGLSHTKEYQATYCANRRALIKNAKGRYTQQEIVNIYSEQQGECYYCRVDISQGFHRDHKIPLSRGGNNFIKNIVLTCPNCNLKKHTKTDAEFIKVLKELSNGREKR